MNVTTVMGITSLSCLSNRINGSDVGLIAAALKDQQLRINYLDGNNYLLADYTLGLSPEEDKLVAIYRSTSNNSKLSIFAVVSNSSTPDRLKCYVLSVDGGKMQLQGSVKISSDYQFMDNTGSFSFIFWHDINNGQHYLYSIGPDLAISSILLHNDYYSFTAT